MIRYLRSIIRKILGRPSFEGTGRYWETRYKTGGTSGPGSYHQLAIYKAEFINNFVEENHISHIIELGCGDGNQLKLARYPSYSGYDISQTAIDLCNSAFAHDRSKSFFVYGKNNIQETADLALSLDVLYHLIENHVYRNYLNDLFSTSRQFVIIYSCNKKDDGQYASHVRPREFTKDVERWFRNWSLIHHEKNRFPLEKYGPEQGSWSDFYVYRKENIHGS